mmetsp:Transcript_14446/g.29136  ORF Transcript_14446/g.29136 Transcript_14446/m.29136 type:complete len:209 (-) Transcript_14446:834-1460(-)
MGYFRERRRARQEARLAQQQAEAAAGNGMHPSAEEALVSEEARLAEEARRMILGDVGNGNGVGNGGGGMPPSSQSPAHAQSPQQLHTAQLQSQSQQYEPTPQELTSILSPSAEQKILALHQQFDTDEDGCLSHQELQALQNATSGADMSLHEYTMICHALRCEPRRGITLDALRLTYATVEDCDANIGTLVAMLIYICFYYILRGYFV